MCFGSNNRLVHVEIHKLHCLNGLHQSVIPFSSTVCIGSHQGLARMVGIYDTENAKRLTKRDATKVAAD